MHPRRIYSITKIGIGIPKAQSKIHPTFPSSLLRIAILHFFRTWNFSSSLASLFPVTGRFNGKPPEQQSNVGERVAQGFPRHGKQLVPHAREAADIGQHVNQEATFGVDQQFVDPARILIPATDHRLGSGRLTAPPRPVVSSATAEEQKQYDYYQDGFHIITSSLGGLKGRSSPDLTCIYLETGY